MAKSRIQQAAWEKRKRRIEEGDRKIMKIKDTAGKIMKVIKKVGGLFKRKKKGVKLKTSSGKRVQVNF